MDQIRSKKLKLVTNEFSDVLAFIIKKSCTTRLYKDDFRCASIKSIHLIEDKLDMPNYRLSNSNLAKVFERVLRINKYDFTQKKHIGFKKNVLLRMLLCH